MMILVLLVAGEQLAMVVSVAGLASVLSAARVAPAPGAAPPRPHPRAYLLQSMVGGIPLVFHPLKENVKD